VNRQVAPRTLQVVGLLLLVGSFVYTAVSGKPSVEFTSAAMTLITLGSVWNQQQALPKPPPPREYEQPPAVPPAEEKRE
jgi:hypothetical protein